jgi:hypothetical protein
MRRSCGRDSRRMWNWKNNFMRIIAEQFVFWDASAVWSNILANAITLVLTIFVGFVCYRFLGRRALSSFFGVRQKKYLRIYTGWKPNPDAPMGLVGFEEFNEAKNLEGLFKSVIPGLGDQPGLLRFLQLSDVHTEILPAPHQDSSVRLDCSIISLGASNSNRASLLIETELRSPVRYVGQDLHIPNLPPITNGQQGIIAKIRANGNCYFYVAGGSEPATAGCARYLIKNWRAMRKKYGDNSSFYYLIEVKTDSQKTPFSFADHPLQTV